MVKSREIRGFLCILGATTLWGGAVVVAKSLFGLGLSPSELVQIRLTIASAILFLLILFFDRRLLRIDLSEIPYFLIFGTVGVVGNQLSYYFTVSRIQVAPAVLIQYLFPIWITLFAFFFQRKPVSRGTALALLLAAAGCYLAVGGFRIDLLRLNRVGILGGILSSFFAAFYALYGEKGLRKHSPWTLILYGFSVGALSYSFFSSPLRLFSAGYTPKVWMAILYISVFATLVPFGLYFKGIGLLGAPRASIAAAWELVMSGLAAYLALGETLHPIQMMGGVAVIAAVVLLHVSKENTLPDGKGRVEYC
jgi:drug/metabolite transporter (DMT)-like permease